MELPRRPYNDIEAEMANRLSIVYDYQAWSRLIYRPKSRGEQGSPRLIERHFAIENITEGKYDANIARQVRERSRSLARPRAEVEKEIKHSCP